MFELPPPLSAPGQEPSAAAGSGGGVIDALWAFLQAPFVIEALLAVALLTIVAWFGLRLIHLMRNATARAALSDYLFGVEQALQGDLQGAQKRLEKVLQQDPENHFARLCYGKVLGELGQAEQAHQQHLYLQKAFAVDSAENELMLARSLFAAGLPAEAADVAEAAAPRLPQPAEGLQFVYRARLRSGDQEAAARAGQEALRLLRDDGQRAAFAADLARTLAEVGITRWRRGDLRTAQKLLRDAEGLHGGAQSPLLAARLSASQNGVEATARTLLGAPSEVVPAGERALVPAAMSRDAQVVATAATTENLPMATFSGLLEPARWRCRACAAPLVREVAACPRCGEHTPAALLEPALVDELEGTAETMDRIDANDAHVQRLVQAFASGDERSRGELMHLGEAAVPELLRSAWRSGSEAVRARAIDVLREFGPEFAPALFRASDELSQRRLVAFGEGPAVIVGRIVQGYDKAAQPYLEPLFASARSDHRRILIDYYLGLGDVAAFEAVLRRFPPMEILHRCNNAEPEVLRRFLQAIPRGHFVAESLLLEPTFYRDDELLRAVPGAEDPEVLVALMRARGPTRALVTALVRGCDDPELAATAQRVLLEFGEKVLEHALQAYSDPDRSVDGQKRLARVLCCGGAAAAGHIADSFGPEPTPFDDELRRLLVVIGDEAVDKMAAAYERSGWLEIVSAGLLRRHNNRRVQLANALGELRTKPAIKALKALLKQERDDNLRLHLSRVLHEAEGGSGG